MFRGLKPTEAGAAAAGAGGAAGAVAADTTGDPLSPEGARSLFCCTRVSTKLPRHDGLALELPPINRRNNFWSSDILLKTVSLSAFWLGTGRTVRPASMAAVMHGVCSRRTASLLQALFAWAGQRAKLLFPVLSTISL